jgi:deoxyadenosine/deoxycytidine kinase
MERDFVCIDGTVGAGKSTLMKLFEEQGFTSFPEPVVDNPLLDKYYRDKKKYVLELQEFFLHKRAEQLYSMTGYSQVVSDRSIYGDEIFAKMFTITVI